MQVEGSWAAIAVYKHTDMKRDDDEDHDAKKIGGKSHLRRKYWNVHNIYNERFIVNNIMFASTS